VDNNQKVGKGGAPYISQKDSTHEPKDLSVNALDSHETALGLENTVKPKRLWNERAHDYLNELDQKLESHMPANKAQKVLDNFYTKSIEPLLIEGEKLNKWINKNEYGAWYKNLTSFIIKLPIRAIRNILNLAYNIIKGTIYAFVHPLKALNNFAHFFIHFLHSLTIPSTYTKIGAGIMGAAAGQAIYSAGHLGIPTIVGLAVGGSLIGIGLMAGAIKSGIEAPKGLEGEAIKAELWSQLKAIPESALTGFIMGAIFGAIQKAAVNTAQPLGLEDSQKFVKEFLTSKGVHLDPSTYTVSLDPHTTGSGTISVTFSGPELKSTLAQLQQHNLFHGTTLYTTPNHYTIKFHDPNLILSGDPNNMMPGDPNNIGIQYSADNSSEFSQFNRWIPQGLQNIFYPTIEVTNPVTSAVSGLAVVTPVITQTVS